LSSATKLFTRFALPLLAVALVLGFAQVCLAQESTETTEAEQAPPEDEPEITEEQKEEAKQRYKDGVNAYRKRRYKDAVDLFLEADALVPSAALSYNIARAYEKLGDDSSALRWYRDYLRRDPESGDRKAVEKLIEGFEAKLAAKGVQQLTILTQPRGATVVIDEEPVGVS
jgi:tetratricopeptide (TPR) repeat protein